MTYSIEIKSKSVPPGDAPFDLIEEGKLPVEFANEQDLWNAISAADSLANEVRFHDLMAEVKMTGYGLRHLRIQDN